MFFHRKITFGFSCTICSGFNCIKVKMECIVNEIFLLQFFVVVNNFGKIVA